MVGESQENLCLQHDMMMMMMMMIYSIKLLRFDPAELLENNENNSFDKNKM